MLILVTLQYKMSRGTYAYSKGMLLITAGNTENIHRANDREERREGRSTANLLATIPGSSLHMPIWQWRHQY